MVQATLETYKAAIKAFLPTPAKSHYIFNLRDFSRVIRGVLLVPPSVMKEDQKFIRLWVHEVSSSVGYDIAQSIYCYINTLITICLVDLITSK